VKRALRIFRVLLCLVLIPVCALAQVNPKEYQVKAAFIYNFVKFVEWPGPLAVSKQSSINICIIGSNPFGEAGRQIFERASTPALQLNLVQVKSSAAATSCHIAFISRSEEGKLADILADLKKSPVLTVSEIDDFASRGGIVGFVTDDNKVKLIVNTGAATTAGLRVDAQLLEIAMQVLRQ